MPQVSSTTRIYLTRTSDPKLTETNQLLRGFVESAGITVLNEPEYSRGFKTFLEDTDRQIQKAECLVCFYDESFHEVADSQVISNLQKRLRRQGRSLFHEGFPKEEELGQLTFPEWEILLALESGIPIFIFSRQSNSFLEKLLELESPLGTLIVDESEEALTFYLPERIG